jgi:hypothetical protein
VCVCVCVCSCLSAAECARPRARHPPFPPTPRRAARAPAPAAAPFQSKADDPPTPPPPTPPRPPPKHPCPSQEVLDGEYDHRADVWSCGVVAYVLLCGAPPFGGTRASAIFRQIRDDGVPEM